MVIYIIVLIVEPLFELFALMEHETSVVWEASLLLIAPLVTNNVAVSRCCGYRSTWAHSCPVMILSARWVTFRPPRPIIVVVVLPEYLWDILARNWANPWALLIDHGGLLRLIVLHKVVEGAANRVPSPCEAAAVCKSLTRLLGWLEVGNATVESRVAIVVIVSWLDQGRSREVVDAHVVITLDPNMTNK